MKTWIRLYTSLPTNRKVQSLPPALFKFWVNCLAFAGRSEDGILPSCEDMAWELHEKEARVGCWVLELVERRLLESVDAVAGRFRPHNWAFRQFEESTSAERVRRFRERNKSVTPTVTGVTGNDGVTGYSRARSVLVCSDLDSSESEKQERAENSNPEGAQGARDNELREAKAVSEGSPILRPGGAEIPGEGFGRFMLPPDSRKDPTGKDCLQVHAPNAQLRSDASGALDGDKPGGGTTTHFPNPSKSSNGSGRKEPSSEVEALPMAVFDAAWRRHSKQRKDQPLQLVIQLLSTRNGSMDWTRLKAIHPAYCEYWKRHGWSFCPLTLLEWIDGGMIDPPAEAEDPIARRQRMREELA